MNKDTPPLPDMMVEIPFTETVPDVSWYRHESWKPEQFKRFRHYHTLCQDITGFHFFNEIP